MFFSGDVFWRLVLQILLGEGHGFWRQVGCSCVCLGLFSFPNIHLPALGPRGIASLFSQGRLYSRPNRVTPGCFFLRYFFFFFFSPGSFCSFERKGLKLGDGGIGFGRAILICNDDWGCRGPCLSRFPALKAPGYLRAQSRLEGRSLEEGRRPAPPGNLATGALATRGGGTEGGSRKLVATARESCFCARTLSARVELRAGSRLVTGQGLG